MIGEDPEGEFLLRHLEKQGLSTVNIHKKAGARTGRCAIKLTAAGEARIHGYPGANLLWEQKDWQRTLQLLEQADCLLVQLEIPPKFVLELLAVAQDWNKLTILNLGPPRKIELPALTDKTYLVLNAQEAYFYTGIFPGDSAAAQRAATVLGQKAKHVIITLASQGAFLASADSFHLIPAPHREVADSTGAGDVFCAALAVALLRGASAKEATGFACKTASVAVTGLGAQSVNPLTETISPLFP
jgi:ribokinase